MKTPGEWMPRSKAISNAKSACSTSDQRLGDAVDTGRPLPSAGDLPAGLANRCPTCLVEMEWIHFPTGEGRYPVDGQPTAYVCRNRTCDARVTSAHALVER